MSGQGLALRLALARLRDHHRIEPAAHPALTSFAPTSSPLVIEGLAASTTTPDVDRILFTPSGLSFRELPKLLHKHEGQPIGKITDAFMRSDGLHIRAVIHDALAKTAPAMSVCVSIHSFELRCVDDARKFHACVVSGTVDEISVTEIPAHRLCLITSREAAPLLETQERLQQSLAKFTRSLVSYAANRRGIQNVLQQH